jgi:hypothetical protein
MTFPAKTPFRIGDRDFDVDVGTPGVDEARLPLHLAEIVQEHLEGDGQVLDVGQHLGRENLVVRHASLAHQRGVRREALDVGLLERIQHLVHVGAVGVDINRQRGHFPSPFQRMIRSAASGSVVPVTSGREHPLFAAESAFIASAVLQPAFRPHSTSVS